MEESLIGALKSLANSSAWQEVRDTYLEAKLAECKDVTKRVELGVPVPPDVLYVGKVTASIILAQIIHDIDRFAESNTKKEIDSYE